MHQTFLHLFLYLPVSLHALQTPYILTSDLVRHSVMIISYKHIFHCFLVLSLLWSVAYFDLINRFPMWSILDCQRKILEKQIPFTQTLWAVHSFSYSPSPPPTCHILSLKPSSHHILIFWNYVFFSYIFFLWGRGKNVSWCSSHHKFATTVGIPNSYSV